MRGNVCIEEALHSIHILQPLAVLYLADHQYFLFVEFNGMSQLSFKQICTVSQKHHSATTMVTVERKSVLSDSLSIIYLR